MTRLASAFSKPHPAFVAFITAGDGDTANCSDLIGTNYAGQNQ